MTDENKYSESKDGEVRWYNYATKIVVLSLAFVGSIYLGSWLSANIFTDSARLDALEQRLDSVANDAINAYREADAAFKGLPTSTRENSDYCGHNCVRVGWTLPQSF